MVVAKCPDDQKIIDDLLKKNEDLVKDYKKMREELEKLKKDFEDYKKRHPQNVGIKSGKEYFIKPEVDNTEKEDKTTCEKRKPGAQKGHKGFFRKLPVRVDETVKLGIEFCPHCSSKLSEIQEIRTRIVEDLPIVKPGVVKYEIERRYCHKCKRMVEPELKEALPNSRLSLRTMLIIAYLKTVMRLPEQSVVEMVDRLFGLKVSEGEVMNIIALLSDYLGSEYEKLVLKVREGAARYIDETSWRINGKNVWLWAFVTKGISLYHIADSRSHEVPEKILKEHNGIDVHDGYSAYKTLAKKTKNKQQYCWGHIISNGKELSKFYGEEGAYILSSLKEIYTKAKSFEHRGTDQDIEMLYKELNQKLDIIYESSKCRRFVHNLLKKDKFELFEFVRNPDVESTNNRAERTIRHMVIYRKMSGGSRSDRGAERMAKIMSLFQTMRLMRIDPFKVPPAGWLNSNG